MWQDLHAQILDLVREYYHAAARAASRSCPAWTTVPYAGRVFDAEEMVAAVDAVLDFWLTLGPQGDAVRARTGRVRRRRATPCSSTPAPAPTSSPSPL